MLTEHPKRSRVACVTGATGMIGRRIVKRLLSARYHVRILSRRRCEDCEIEVFNAGLSDSAIVDEFVRGADVLFHCAAELHDESAMWATNVVGTNVLWEASQKYRIKHFCHLSSAGVVGRTSLDIVDEDSPCQPQNLYELTKLEAERIVEKGIPACNTIILRPTNVVDAEHLGELALAVDGSLPSWLKAFLKGGECAHIVHADDVANAAMFFLEKEVSFSPRKYFVSLDHDPLNTVSDLWSQYASIARPNKHAYPAKFPHLPDVVPYSIRRMIGRPGNRGRTKYSSGRLLAEGFEYSMGVREAIENIFNERFVRFG